MIKKSCDNCRGTGKLTLRLDKEAKAYMAAKRKIRKLDPKMTDAEAEKILDDEIARTP